MGLSNILQTQPASLVSSVRFYFCFLVFNSLNSLAVIMKVNKMQTFKSNQNISKSPDSSNAAVGTASMMNKHMVTLMTNNNLNNFVN